MYQKVLRKYKFYLSFENALCQDYITEKLFLAVFAGARPIVYGGKTREDYNKVIVLAKIDISLPMIFSSTS
jgi:hypothetical protein